MLWELPKETAAATAFSFLGSGLRLDFVHVRRCSAQSSLLLPSEIGSPCRPCNEPGLQDAAVAMTF